MLYMVEWHHRKCNCSNGQSNSQGRGVSGTADANIPAEFQGAQTNVKIWYGTVTSSIGSSWDTYDHTTASNANLPASGNTTFGFDITMGKDYIDRVGGTVYNMKFAVGSTWLAYNTGGGGYWHPTDNTQIHGNARRMFANYITNWRKSLREHQQAGRNPSVIGIAWYQGEEDATLQAAADAYSTNEILFFNTLEAEMGCGTGLKKLIIRIHSGIDGTQHPYRDTVRAQKALTVAALTNATLISVDSYGLLDTAHINGAGQLALGTALSLLF